MIDFDQIRSCSCYGCGLCAVVCPENIINIELSTEGFYIPVISNKGKCAKCSLCENVCSYVHKELAQKPPDIQGYAIYSKDEQTIKTCSSGGVGFEIAKQLIKKGYKVCGVKYAYGKNRAEHFVAETLEDFEESKGSKYLQSYTVDGFKKLSSSGNWCVFGAPCQIDSLRRWIKLKKKEENFVLVDFFCHGVPSYHLWFDYLAFNKNIHNLREIDKVIFRDKRNGQGKDSFAVCLGSGEKENISALKNGDLFYRLYLGNCCLNASCYDKCKFKNQQSSADIRIGDLWSKTYQKGIEGVSAVFANTKKGANVISDLNNSCIIKKEPTDIISEGQMVQNLKMPRIRSRILKDLAKGVSLKYICAYTAVSNKIRQFLSYTNNKILSLFNRT
jgi:coenzyme F420-reducing hydrogenase beta subunit